MTFNGTRQLCQQTVLTANSSIGRQCAGSNNECARVHVQHIHAIHVHMQLACLAQATRGCGPQLHVHIVRSCTLQWQQMPVAVSCCSSRISSMRVLATAGRLRERACVCLRWCCVVLVFICTGRKFLTKINANIGNSAVSSSIEEVRWHSVLSLFVCVCVGGGGLGMGTGACGSGWGKGGASWLRGIWRGWVGGDWRDVGGGGVEELRHLRQGG
mgnify:CR=1 FL=1